MSDDAETPDDELGFDDLVDELEDEEDFQWDEEDLEADEASDETRPVVAFRIGDDLFAVSGESVREIVSATETTEVPGAPGHVLGITVVRRQIVGVLSLRRFLGLGAAPAPEPTEETDENDEPSGRLSSENRTLIVETPHYTVGIEVDEVPGLEQWPESKIDAESVPENMHGPTRRYAVGARRRGDSVCVYLDLEALLADAAV